MTYPISDVTRRIVYSGSAGVGPYQFSFEILTQSDIAVYFNETLLTITSDYTVTINANGTGTVTIVLGSSVSNLPNTSDRITIVGSKGIARTTDFVTGGDLFASSLNEELDAQTIFAQQNSEAILRSLRVPVTEPLTSNLELPSADNRKGYFLYFDDITGNPDVNLGTADMATVAANINEVELVAIDLAGGTLGTSRLYDLGSITSPAGTLSAAPNGYIVTVYNNLSDIQDVAADIAEVAAVGADLLGADNIGTVATDLNGADNIGTVAADLAGSDNIGTVAANIADVNAVAAIDADVTAVAAIDSDVTAVAADATDIGTVATNIADVNAVATALTSVPSGASLVTYDNGTSGLTAVDVQAAIDEIVAAAINAINVIYDNTTSGLTATDAQAAIDELATASLTAGGSITGNLTITGNVTITGTLNAGSI